MWPPPCRPPGWSAPISLRTGPTRGSCSPSTPRPAPVTFDFAVLAYGLPVTGATCGLKDQPTYYCLSGALANAKFASEEHGLIFPPQSDADIFPRDGSIHEITGSAGAGGLALPFALLPGAAPIAHNGAFSVSPCRRWS